MAATVKKSMRLLILDATGGIGQELVDQAPEREYHLTAFVRTPQKLRASHEGLGVIQGNRLAADAVVDALECRDAVLPAIGPPGLGLSTITGDAAQATVTAREAAGTRRAVIVGVGMLFADSLLLGRVFRTIFMRNIAKDSAEIEGIVNTSELDWTIVRPPRLTNGPRTGRYRVADDHWPRGAGGAVTISRADVAHLLWTKSSALRPSPAHRGHRVHVACEAVIDHAFTCSPILLRHEAMDRVAAGRLHSQQPLNPTTLTKT